MPSSVLTGRGREGASDRPGQSRSFPLIWRSERAGAVKGEFALPPTCAAFFRRRTAATTGLPDFGAFILLDMTRWKRPALHRGPRAPLPPCFYVHHMWCIVY